MSTTEAWWEQQLWEQWRRQRWQWQWWRQRQQLYLFDGPFESEDL